MSIWYSIALKPVSTCRRPPIRAGTGWQQCCRLQSELTWTQNHSLLEKTRDICNVDLYAWPKINIVVFSDNIRRWKTLRNAPTSLLAMHSAVTSPPVDRGRFRCFLTFSSSCSEVGSASEDSVVVRFPHLWTHVKLTVISIMHKENYVRLETRWKARLEEFRAIFPPAYRGHFQ